MRYLDPALGLVLVIGAIALTAPALQATIFRQPGDDWPPADRGWLVISGPVSAAACEATRAYNVATGDAFTLDTCTGRSVAGTTPVAGVREALSALLTRVPDSWTVGERRTVHTWRWVVDEERSLIGELPWSDAGWDGAARAVSLVRRFEDGVADGCAPALPPPTQVLAAVLPRMVNPISADRSQDLTTLYRLARATWAQLEACRAPGP